MSMALITYDPAVERTVNVLSRRGRCSIAAFHRHTSEQHEGNVVDCILECRPDHQNCSIHWQHLTTRPTEVNEQSRLNGFNDDESNQAMHFMNGLVSANKEIIKSSIESRWRSAGSPVRADSL